MSATFSTCDLCHTRRLCHLIRDDQGGAQIACIRCLGLDGKRRGSKMRNVRVMAQTAGGPRLMDSGLERSYLLELQLRESAGDIADLVIKPRLELFQGFFYKPDFAFVEEPRRRARRVWVDTKGPTSQRWRDVCKAWKVFGPGPLLEVKRGRNGGFVVTREIHGGKAVAA